MRYIFDLDNTLYDEKTFVFPLYQYALSLNDVDAPEVYLNLARERFKQNGNKKLFDDLRLLDNEDLFWKVLATYRDLASGKRKFLTKLYCFSWVSRFISEIDFLDEKILVLSDGRCHQQLFKFNCLDISSKNDYFYFYPAILNGGKKTGDFTLVFDKFFDGDQDLCLIGDSEDDKSVADRHNINFENVRSFSKRWS